MSAARPRIHTASEHNVPTPPFDVRAITGGSQLRVRVVPRASREAIAGVRDGALLVRLTAPPVEGAANAALLRFLARTLGVPASTLMLTHGTKGREKTILVTSLSPAQIANALASFL